VRLRDLAREREQKPQRVLGSRDDRRLGSVDDDDAALGCGGQVDVVHAHPGPADHLQPIGAVDQLLGELGRAADDDRVVVADSRREIPVGVDNDVESLPKEVDPRLRDGLPDKDAGHGDAPWNAARAWVAPTPGGRPGVTPGSPSLADDRATR